MLLHTHWRLLISAPRRLESLRHYAQGRTRCPATTSPLLTHSDSNDHRRSQDSAVVCSSCTESRESWIVLYSPCCKNEPTQQRSGNTLRVYCVSCILTIRFAYPRQPLRTRSHSRDSETPFVDSLLCNQQGHPRHPSTDTRTVLLLRLITSFHGTPSTLVAERRRGAHDTLRNVVTILLCDTRPTQWLQRNHTFPGQYLVLQVC